MEDPCTSSFTFFSDQQLSYVDILPPAEVRVRIEVSILSFLKILTSPTSAISDLPLVFDEGDGAKSFIRVWKVMEMCYQILVLEKRVTQRELFYKMISTSPEYLTSQLEVNRTIQDLVSLLQCSRYSLGILASSRGAVSGRLFLQEQNHEVELVHADHRGMLLREIWLC